MKTLAKLLLSIACVGLMTNCEKERPLIEVDDLFEDVQTFSADFVVWEIPQAPIKGSIENTGCQRIWKGEGNSALFGAFTIEMTLTCLIQPGETTGDFCNLSGILTTLNEGDEMYFVIPEGKIECNSDATSEDFETCFNDQATIVGGTGFFLGAKGKFHPNAQIHNGNADQWYALFRSEGSLWK